MNNIKEEVIKIEFDEPALWSASEYSSLNHDTQDTSEAVSRIGLDASTKRNHEEAPTKHVGGDVEARFCKAALGSMDTSDPSKFTPTDAEDCPQTPRIDALPVWSSLKLEAPPGYGNYKEHPATMPSKLEEPDIEDTFSTLNHESNILGLSSNFNLFAPGIKSDINNDQPNLLGLPAASDLLKDSINDQPNLLGLPAASDLLKDSVNDQPNLLGLPAASDLLKDSVNDQPNLLGLPAASDLLKDSVIDLDSSNDRSSPLNVPVEMTSVHSKVSDNVWSSPRDQGSGLHLLLHDVNQNISLTQTHLLGLPSRLSSSKAKIYPSALDYESGLPYAQFRLSSLDSHHSPDLDTTPCGSSDQSVMSSLQSINPQVLFNVVCFSCSQPVKKFLKEHLASSPSCQRAYTRTNKLTSSDSKPYRPSFGKIKVKQEPETNRERFSIVCRNSKGASEITLSGPHKSVKEQVAFLRAYRPSFGKIEGKQEPETNRERFSIVCRNSKGASGITLSGPHKSVKEQAESLRALQKFTVAENSFNLDEITRVKCMICKDLCKSLDDHLWDSKRCLIRYQVKYGTKKFPFSCKEKSSTLSEHLGHMEQEIQVKQEGNISIKKEGNDDKNEINVCVKEEMNIGVKEESKVKEPVYARKEAQCNSIRRCEALDTKSSNDCSQPINSTRLNVPFQRKNFQFWGREVLVEGTTPLPANPLSGASCDDNKSKWNSLPGSINKKASRYSNPSHSSRPSNPRQVSCASSCTKLLRGHDAASRRVESSSRKVSAISTPSAGTGPMSSSALRRHGDLSYKEQLKTLRMEKLRRLTEKKPPPTSYSS